MLLKTYNTGDGDTFDSTCRVVSSSDLTFLQEMWSREHWPSRIRQRTGHICEKGNGRFGERAVQVWHNPQRLHQIEPITKLLLDRTFVGDGPGGNYNLPKYAVGGIYEDLESKRNFVALSLHGLSGQNDNRHREAAHQEWMQNLVKLLATFGNMAQVFGGDFNFGWNSDSAKKLVRAGYVNNHDLMRPLPTHGANWTPDQIWSKKNDKVSFLSQDTVRLQSDHKVLAVNLKFKPGRPG